jgi:hypothetical protein
MADGDRNEYVNARSAAHRHLDSPAHAHALAERHADPLPTGDADADSDANSHAGTHAHAAADFHGYATANFHTAKQPDSYGQPNNTADPHGDAAPDVYLDPAAKCDAYLDRTAKRDVYGIAYSNANADKAGLADPFADGGYRRGDVHGQP